MCTVLTRLLKHNIVTTVAILTTSRCHEIDDKPGESDIDDGFDWNVNLNSVVVHRRQVLFV